MSRLKFRSLFPTGSLNISGSVTASFFVGDGSGLTNLPLSDVSALNAFTSSANSRLDDLEAATSSYLQAADLSELNIFTGSTDSRLDSIEAATSSYLQAADLSELNLFTGSASTRLDSIEAATSSYATITELNSSSSILQSNLDIVSSSLAAETAQLLDFSASLDNTFATDVELNTVSASVKTFATDADTTLSASLAVDIATNVSDINTISSSLALRVTNQETFSSSLNDTFTTDIELNTVSASVKTFATDADTTLSASLAVDIATNVVNIESSTTRLTSLEAATGSYLIGEDTGSLVYSGSFDGASTLTLYLPDGNLDLDLSALIDAGTDISALNTFTGSAESRLDSIESETGSYATTGSNQFTGDQNITGDLTVTGTVTAQEYHSEFVSASIIYESGSTKFGDTSDDTHEFTGSISVSGSITAVDISIDDWGSVSASLSQIESSQFLTSTNSPTKTGGSLTFSDNVKLKFGDSDDLQIYHNGVSNIIEDAGTGGLTLRGNNIYLQDDSSGGYGLFAQGLNNGAFELYYDNSKKFTTANLGVQVTGSLIASAAVTASDAKIDDWGSVSSSLAEISASAAAANSITLQGVTDNGSLTTNHISISSSLNVSQSIISKGENVLDFAVAMAIALG